MSSDPAGPDFPETIGGRSVADNLARAVAQGALARGDDGRLSLRGPALPPAWLHSGPQPPCRQNRSFLFHCAYGEAQVPWGCRNCFKVKVRLGTFRQLRAAAELCREIPELSAKCGSEVDMAMSADRYGMFVYLDGLEAARAAKARLRALVDAHPALGGEVPVIIKRGCTDYEMACGPSDRWTFPDFLPDLEQRLYAWFAPPPARPPTPKAAVLACWIATAYRIGDDTYLDATGGRRLYPPVVTYD